MTSARVVELDGTVRRCVWLLYVTEIVTVLIEAAEKPEVAIECTTRPFIDLMGIGRRYCASVVMPWPSW